MLRSVYCHPKNLKTVTERAHSAPATLQNYRLHILASLYQKARAPAALCWAAFPHGPTALATAGSRSAMGTYIPTPAAQTRL